MRMGRKKQIRICAIALAVAAILICVSAFAVCKFLSSPIKRLPYENESLPEYVMSIEWKNWRKSWVDADHKTYVYITGPYELGELKFTATKTIEKENYDITVCVTNMEENTKTYIRYSSDTSLPEKDRVQYVQTVG